jgi:putative membrane protein
LAMMAIGLGLASVSPKIRMSLVAGKIIEQAAITKARDIFLQEEVFKTIDRSGILIYISELEHEVVVLGDSGINAKILDSAWQDVVNTIVRSIKQNEPTLGIIKAIDMCKTLLLENGFIVRADDTNELSDDIRIEE